MTQSDIELKQIKPKDLKKAMVFAKEGMHLSWYVNNKIELNLYSRYAFYEVLLKSTTVLAAYLDDQLVGFLFAEFYEEHVVYNIWRHRLYCWLFSKVMKVAGYQNASDSYEKANRDMLENFKKKNPNPDGELTFFAVNPEIKGKGIGTLLLEELTRRNKNKLIYLYSDSRSTYQFYLHRGFEQSEKREISLPIGEEKHVPLTCYLFSKRL